MKLAIISFTRAGSECCKRLVQGFAAQGEHCRGYAQPQFLGAGCDSGSPSRVRGHEEGRPQGSGESGTGVWLALVPLTEPLTEWAGARFGDSDGLIFIGATGIAVRAIAPWIRDKKTDPAVVVVDANATFSISLLSGHVGGANCLAQRAAAILGATPVITTATDLEGKPAIDLLAKAAGLAVADWDLAKQVSAALLEGQPVGFASDYSWPETLPEGFTGVGEMLSEGCPGARLPDGCRLLVWVTVKKEPPPEALAAVFRGGQGRILRLVPPVCYVGIGCRKGTPMAVLRQAVTTAMDQQGLALEGIAALASIDLKQQEAGLIELADELGARFMTFTQMELQAVAGDFTASEFVKQITGVDNVCERAALAAGEGQAGLFSRKQIVSGVAIAVAIKPWKGMSPWQIS